MASTRTDTIRIQYTNDKREVKEVELQHLTPIFSAEPNSTTIIADLYVYAKPDSDIDDYNLARAIYYEAQDRMEFFKDYPIYFVRQTKISAALVKEAKLAYAAELCEEARDSFRVSPSQMGDLQFKIEKYRETEHYEKFKKLLEDAEFRNSMADQTDKLLERIRELVPPFDLNERLSGNGLAVAGLFPPVTESKNETTSRSLMRHADEQQESEQASEQQESTVAEEVFLDEFVIKLSM